MSQLAAVETVQDFVSFSWKVVDVVDAWPSEAADWKPENLPPVSLMAAMRALRML